MIKKKKKLKADDGERQVSSLFTIPARLINDSSLLRRSKKIWELHILTRNGVKYNLKTSCNLKSDE
jgi:hypothetical protein